MQSINDSLVAIVGKMCDNPKHTIKAALVKVEELGVDVSSLNTKTREGFIQSLDSLRVSLNEAEELQEEASALTELEQLEGEIKATIIDAGKATFHLGELLLRAKEAHESTSEFLSWVDTKFGIKKAWAYRLMRVATVFSEEVWQGVSVQVLYTLQSQATDTQLEQARSLASDGNLNHKSLAELLEPAQPIIKVVEEGEPSKEALSSTADSIIESGIEPTETMAQLPQVSKVEEGNLAEVVQGLREQLAASQQQVTELLKQVAEYNKPRIQASSAPMLPQFTSNCLYARLGLSAEDAGDKSKVLEAFKSLCKAGYGRQHEAFEMIDEARHKLIHSQEAA